jgi:hypothetical protein
MFLTLLLVPTGTWCIGVVRRRSVDGALTLVVTVWLQICEAQSGLCAVSMLFMYMRRSRPRVTVTTCRGDDAWRRDDLGDRRLAMIVVAILLIVAAR